MLKNLLRGACALLPLAAPAADDVAPAETRTLGRIQAVSAPESESTQAATRLPLTLRETPQSVTVIDRQRLDDQQLISLRDVLDQTPGIYSFAWDTERVIFTSRGFRIDSLMYDGVPAETNFSTDSVDETIDTAMYERIEIVRGATGLATGAGSPAASINLVRKRADSHELSGNVGVTAGSWNNLRIEADVGTPLTSAGNVRARFVGAWQSQESYQDLYENDRKVFYAVLDADVSDATLLSLYYDFQDNAPTSNTWGSFPLYLADGTFAGWPRSVTTATDWAFWNRRKQSIAGELSHEFTNGWTLRSSFTWREYEEDLALFYVYGFPDPQTGLGLDPYAYRSQAQIVEKALDVYASGPVSLFGREHDLVVGYNGSRARNTGDEFAHGELPAVGNFFEWDGSYPRPDFAADGILLNDIDSRQNGVYLSGRFTLADPLELIAGARYSTWKTDHFYLYDSPDVTFSHDFSKVIPYAGLVFDVSTDYSLFASFTEIFKPQNSRDENGSYLDPVAGRSLEFGLKAEHFDGRLDTALTLFETLQDNVATPLFDPDTGETVLLPDGTAASAAIDGTRTRGFELEAQGRLNDQWRLSLGWSHYRMEDADGAAVDDYIPGTLVRAFATWNPAALEGLSLGAGVNWQSDSQTFVGNPTGGALLRQDAVLQLSLMARYAFANGLELQVNGENLLDEKYFVLDNYDNSYYGAPANVSASLRWRF